MLAEDMVHFDQSVHSSSNDYRFKFELCLTPPYLAVLLIFAVHGQASGKRCKHDDYYVYNVLGERVSSVLYQIHHLSL